MQESDVSAIYNSGQHLLGLINDILDLSKIEAGKMELAFETVDLREIIRGVMSTAIALVKDKPVVNVPGCPPIPMVITAVLAQFLTFGRLPDLDIHGRPTAFFGQTIHDRCYRRPFYEQGRFAETFDDEGARKGWCLFKLGCKGPITYNACATVKWNAGTSFPIEAGHGCIGCSQPDFWDQAGFYQPLSTGNWGNARTVGTAIGVGAALGVASAALARKRQKAAEGG
jgi:hydrogenase small subunit